MNSYLVCLGHERLFARVFDAVNRDFELQVFERRVIFDIGECFLEVLGFCVSGKGFKDAAGGLGA
jgi:hypothetical protein